MADRIDVLPRKRPALRHLRGDLLATELDDELQAIVEQTSRELGTPIALVSLVLENTQLFRAHHGLPPDLAAAGATDRDVSFCQFVVRDREIFEVNDARTDPRVPQDLVDRYGIAAYLGAPVAVDGEVIGSLCVIDVAPREFTPADRETLQEIASVASARLTGLASVRRSHARRALVDRAVGPMFAELRNLLQPLTGGVDMSKVAIAELGSVVRLARHVIATAPDVPAAGALGAADAAFGDLGQALDDIERAALEIARALAALEKASLQHAARASLTEVIEAASTLAHHQTKLTGGVRWTGCTPGCYVRTPRSIGVTVVAATLAGLANELYEANAAHAIVVAVEQVESTIRLRFGASGVPQPRLAELGASLASSLEDGPSLRLRVGDAELVIELPLVTG